MSTPGSPAKKRKPKEKKQIIDSVTELADRPGAGLGRGRKAVFGEPMSKDVSNILADNRFLPRSSTVMRLLEIRDDPIAHFLPTKVTPNGTFFAAAPPGLAPELAEMFMRPLHPLPPKGRDAATGGSPSKKRKLMNGEENDVEQARRAESVAHSVMGDILKRGSVGPDLDFGDQMGMMDDYEMPLPEFHAAGADMDRARSQSVALSRSTTPGPDGMLFEGEETYADLDCSIGMFDDRSQNKSQEAEPERPDSDGKGCSKNTIKALGVIRKELHHAGGQDKAASFKKLSVKVC